jgi:hypothetical protein
MTDAQAWILHFVFYRKMGTGLFSINEKSARLLFSSEHLFPIYGIVVWWICS